MNAGGDGSVTSVEEWQRWVAAESETEQRRQRREEPTNEDVAQLGPTLIAWASAAQQAHVGPAAVAVVAFGRRSETAAAAASSAPRPPASPVLSSCSANGLLNRGKHLGEPLATAALLLLLIVGGGRGLDFSVHVWEHFLLHFVLFLFDSLQPLF